MRSTDTIARPRLQMVGRDGNAFAILGRAKEAARRAGWGPDQVAAMVEEATSGDYDHLLGVMMRRFDVV